MRAAGVPERYCTGDASDWEKFQKWAETVPQTLRNPLYHWTHLELKRPLGISDRLLGPDTAEGIWDECNAKLARPEFSCPRHHAADERRAGLHDRRSDRHAGTSPRRSPPIASFPDPRAADVPARPGDGRRIAGGFQRLGRPAGERSGIDVGDDFDRFLDALRQRHDFFHAAGCRLSDHGLETFYAGRLYARRKSRPSFAACAAASRLRPAKSPQFKSAMLYELAVMDAREGLGAAVPLRRPAEQQHADVPAARAGHGLRFDRRLATWPGRWPASSTASTATAGWPRRSSTTSTRPTTTWWPR